MAHAKNSRADQTIFDRRIFIGRAAGSCLSLILPDFSWATPRIGFNELYGSFGAKGFSLSEKAKSLVGQSVEFRGFMAPPLKPEAKFFVLTRYPVTLCPFCNTDAEWPSDIVVVYLDRPESFAHNSGGIRVTGMLEYGAAIDTESGMVSLLRLRNARWEGIV